MVCGALGACWEHSALCQARTVGGVLLDHHAGGRKPLGVRWESRFSPPRWLRQGTDHSELWLLSLGLRFFLYSLFISKSLGVWGKVPGTFPGYTHPLRELPSSLGAPCPVFLFVLCSVPCTCLSEYFCIFSL